MHVKSIIIQSLKLHVGFVTLNCISEVIPWRIIIPLSYLCRSTIGMKYSVIAVTSGYLWNVIACHLSVVPVIYPPGITWAQCGKWHITGDTLQGQITGQWTVGVTEATSHTRWACVQMTKWSESNYPLAPWHNYNGEQNAGLLGHGDQRGATCPALPYSSPPAYNTPG